MLKCVLMPHLLQMEREARYNHYVSKLQWYNRSKVDERFMQRVAHMAGMQLAEQLPHVVAGTHLSRMSLLRLSWLVCSIAGLWQVCLAAGSFVGIAGLALWSRPCL